MAETMEAAMHRICDLSQEMDVHLLDNIVATAYDPMNPQRASANNVLMALKENPDIWVRADAIMERAINSQTRFFGLQLLEDVIRVRYVLEIPFVDHSCTFQIVFSIQHNNHVYNIQYLL